MQFTQGESSTSPHSNLAAPKRTVDAYLLLYLATVLLDFRPTHLYMYTV